MKFRRLAVLSGFMKKAVEASACLENCNYYCKIMEDGGRYCHGDYNYHNLIRQANRLATVGFEKAGKGIPLLDLTYLMRKSLEKNGWDRKKGMTILESYAKKRIWRRTNRNLFTLCSCFRKNTGSC